MLLWTGSLSYKHATRNTKRSEAQVKNTILIVDRFVTKIVYVLMDEKVTSFSTLAIFLYATRTIHETRAALATVRWPFSWLVQFCTLCSSVLYNIYKLVFIFKG